MSVLVPLTQGRHAVIDDCDASRVLPLKWSLHITKTRLYARHAWVDRGKWHSIKLHRFILDLPPGKPLVDHRDGDGLNNRRSNIRVCTHSQNLQNSRKKSRSGLKGVFRQSDHSFRASIRTDAGTRYLGTYDSAEEAARMVDAAAHLAQGEFAWMNFDDLDQHALERAQRILNGDISALPSRPLRYQRKLTDGDVVEIRRRYAIGGVLQRDLAAEFAVTVGSIGHCINGRTFQHIQDPPPMREDKRRKDRAA